MTAQQPTSGAGEEDPNPYGPPSPLEPGALSVNLRAPVSRGFALVLTALLLLALLWVDHRQSVRVVELEGMVSGVDTSASFPADPDPQTCWLAGVAAGSRGSALISKMGASSGNMTDCQMYATRGSLGQDLEGN